MPEEIKFIPDICECCGQTTNYKLGLDHGSAQILLDILRAIIKKGINEIHPSQELDWSGGKKWFASNVSRLRKHGLIAFLKDKKGYYVLTTKAGKFFRGEPIPRYAIISKKDDCTAGYWYADKYNITLKQLLKDDEIPMWEGELAQFETMAAFQQVETGQLHF